MLSLFAASSGYTMGTAPARAGARSTSVQMANIADTAASLQGPEIFWGSAGVLLGYEEADIKAYDGFGTFISACKDAGLGDALTSGENTVFAPTDAVIEEFVENGGEITESLLKYHILPGKIPSSAFSTADLKTLEGSSLTYRRQYRKDFIDNATPGVKSEGPSKSSNWPCDVECDNGILHSCNQVLTPGFSENLDGYAAGSR